MNYQEALRVLDRRGEARIELGLERVREHLRALGSPHERVRALHVAGTNGKGSVCAMLDASLRAAGYKTGLYTSPHLHDPRERMTLDGEQIPEAEFARLLERALAAPLGDRLTYFELLTSMAFQWFYERGAEAVVLETGLGGRLDATNVVPRPLVSVITSIGLDHAQFLGPTLAHVAREKAAIAKAGRPLVCPPLPEEALAPVLEAARAAGADLRVTPSSYAVASVDWERGRQRLRGPEGEVELSLLGAAQAANASLARAALDACEPELRVSPEAWRQGLAEVSWPGRFEVVRAGGRRVVLDGAHNGQAAERLAQTWAASPWAAKPSLWIVALMRDKDAAAVLSPLAPHAREVVCVRAPSPRSHEPEALAALAREHMPAARVSAAADAQAALSAWLDARGAETAVVFGSFYLTAEAARVLRRKDHAFTR